MARALAPAIACSLFALAAGLAPTKIVITKECPANTHVPVVTDWVVTAPDTTTPNLPHFNFSVSSATLTPGRKLVWLATGSLGLPKHPLGVLKFAANGSACDETTAYIYDGVLGKMAMDFPPCSAVPASSLATGFAMSAHVNVWTVIPALPPLLSSGFDIKLTLVDVSTADPSVVLCLNMELSQPPWSGADPKQDVCGLDLPVAPAPATPLPAIPTVIVDLDAPAEERWTHIVKPRAQMMIKLVDTFLDSLGGDNNRINGTVIRLLLDVASVVEMRRMPPQFAREMKGIAQQTGVAVGFIWVLNMMYELTGLCTSVVAQAEDGTIWHGRNLDFGIFMGTSPTTHTWTLTQLLRDVLVDVQFQRGGKTLYNATTYAGFVGLLSGNKGGQFSLSVDTRYDATVDEGVIGWLLGNNNDCQFVCFQTRLVMEGNTTYASALDSLVSYKALGPAYIIIGGPQKGQGAVIAKKFNATAERNGERWANEDVWNLSDELDKGSFYVLETNYDRTGAPAPFDDRRFPAEGCLSQVGQKGLGAETLMKIMSTNPTRNALTTFSSVMSPSTGYFYTIQQYCKPGEHCAPF